VRTKKCGKSNAFDHPFLLEKIKENAMAHVKKTQIQDLPDQEGTCRLLW
jgi:hypothetical protein